MSYIIKLAFKTFCFYFFLVSNSIAIEKKYNLLCVGELITQQNNKESKITTIQKIVYKNNRLFIPGMMLLCNKNNNIYNCQTKRIDSIWDAKLDVQKKLFSYYSNNVSQNRKESFTSTCKNVITK